MPADRPPILILMTDQQRADGLGCAADSPLRTPNMDRICAEGTRFTNACTVSPLCMPARASFVSGLYPHNHGIWFNAGRLPADDETLFHHLQRAGYHVAYVGKSHFYSHRREFHTREMEPYMRRRGIDTVREATGPWATTRARSFVTDHWEEEGLWEVFKGDYARRGEAGRVEATWPSPLPEEEHLDSRIGLEALEVIENYQGEKPLCLMVGFGGPHEPWDAPGRYAEMYDPAECPVGIREEGLPGHLPGHARERLREGLRGIEEETARLIHALYYGKISLLDHWFGRIMDAYEQRGWLQDALVLHWSDHGEMLCDHDRLTKKVFYEGSLGIVMNMSWPGRIPAGRECDALVETIDAFPTLLEALGAGPSERCLGRSMWPCLEDPSREIREAAFSEVGDAAMVRTRRHKYACDEAGRGYMLFDLQEDPREVNNLVGRPGGEQIERELRERLLEFYLRTQVKQRD